MNTLGVLLGGVGALFSGIAAVVTLLYIRHHKDRQTVQGAPDPTAPARHGDPLLWTASAAAFALAAFVLAATVVIQGLTPHSLPMQFTRLTAEFLGLLSAFAGFGIVLMLREHGNVTAEVGGLALFTGFVVLTGMAIVA